MTHLPLLALFILLSLGGCHSSDSSAPEVKQDGLTESNTFKTGDVCNMPDGAFGYFKSALEQATGKPCDTISADDLSQITELDIIDIPHPGSFKALVNLKTLRMNAWTFNSQGFSAGTFDGAVNLESIEYNSNARVPFSISANSFRNLKKLKTIKIRIQSDNTLYSGAIFKDAFKGLPSLESLEFKTECYNEYHHWNYIWELQEGWSREVDPSVIHMNRYCTKPLSWP